MEDWEERLLEEEFELHIKVIKLSRFIVGDEFKILDEDDKERLENQSAVMQAYHAILLERIMNL